MWIVIGIAIVLLFVFYVGKRFNTYILIARNTTYIYEILSTDFKDRFPNEDVLLSTSGVIDALKYVMEGSLTVDKIATGVLTSKCGKCSLNLIELDITDNPTYHFWVRQPDLLYFAYFVMQLEALIFHVDTRVPPEHILSAVKSKKNAIKKTIKTAQHKYKTEGAPPLLKANTYAFMNGEAFAELRDKLGIIRPTPDELFQELIKRKHWKDIDPEIIKSIFNNAKGDVDAINRFIFISELHDSVGNNFVKLASETSKEWVLSMFALTLYRLGSDLVKALPYAKTEDEVSSLATRAEMAFISSLLCDTFSMESYFGMALLFSEINKSTALEWCAKYKEAEGKLLNTPDEDLNISQLNRKKELLYPEEYHKTLREISKKSQYLNLDETTVDGIPSSREMITELEEELMQLV